MSKQQMIKDIDRWSYEKLERWGDDTMLRYRLIDLQYDEAISKLIVTLMSVTAGFLATRTDLPPQEAGLELAVLMHKIRAKQAVGSS